MSTALASSRSDRQTSRRRELILLTTTVAAVITYVFIINLGALGNPPGWDSAVTVSPAALTIVETDFDVWAVAQMPSSPEGGPSTHATSVVTVGLAVLIGALGAQQAFAAAHILSILLVGGLVASTYLLGRERLEPRVAALVSGVVGVIPVVVQQAADIYLDLPLAIAATLACWAASRRRFILTTALVLLAIAIKSSGVFILPLILFARPRERSMARHLAASLAAGMVAVSPFAVTLATTHRFSGEATAETVMNLIRSSAALLILTVDVFVILAVFALVVYGRIRGRSLDRVSSVSALLVMGFFAVHLATILFSATIAILPRYYIAILPAVLVSVAPAQWPGKRPAFNPAAAALAFIGLVLVFSVINVRGSFYPRANDDFYVTAERSTRAQELLDLQLLGTEELVSLGLPILAERQVYFQLEYPEMGYVEARPDEVIPIFFAYPNEFPETFAMLVERRVANPLERVEADALELGYTLTYEEIAVGSFRSELVVAQR